MPVRADNGNPILLAAHSLSLSLLVAGLLILTFANGFFSALNPHNIPPALDSQNSWLAIDVPHEPQLGEQNPETGEQGHVVDLELSPGAPIQLLVSSLATGDHVAVGLAEIERITGRPKFRPIPISSSPESTLEISPEPVKSSFDSATHPPTSDFAPLSITSEQRLPAKMRDFWIHVTAEPLENPRGYQLIHSELVCFRDSVQVYVDQSVGRGSTVISQAELIAELLDQEVLPTVQEHIGPIRRVDGNPRLTILMTPWLGRLRGGTTQVKGFVRETDFQSDLAPPYSNRAAILYLNTDLPLRTGLKTLLLHEVAHAAIFSLNKDKLQRSSGIDDWLNEGLAHVCERWLGGDWSNLDYRIARFYQAPELAPLIVPDYYRAARWRDHGCRGAAFLFLNTLVQRLPSQENASFARLANWPVIGTPQVPFDTEFRNWTLSLIPNRLHGPTSEKVGKFLNSGPRFHVWNVDQQQSFPLKVAGTATKFIELRSTTPGWFRLRLPAISLDDRWQFTIQKSEPYVPDVGLQVQWEPPVNLGQSHGLATTQEPASRQLVASIQGTLPDGWRWDALACEPTSGENRRTQILEAENFDSIQEQPENTRPDGLRATLTFADQTVNSGFVLKAKLVGPQQRVAWVWCDVAAPLEERIATHDSHISRE